MVVTVSQKTIYDFSIKKTTECLTGKADLIISLVLFQSVASSSADFTPMKHNPFAPIDILQVNVQNEVSSLRAVAVCYMLW